MRDDPAVRARFDPRDAAAKKLDRDASARAAAVEWLARYGAEGEAWVAPAAVDASAAGEGGGGGGGDGDGDGGDGAAPMDADAPASPPGSVPPEGRAGLASAGPTPRAGSARARRPPGAPPLAPHLCWAPERIAADLKRARTIAATLDLEKGVVGVLADQGGNPLTGGAAPAASAVEAANEAAAGGDAGAVPLPPAGPADPPLPDSPDAILAALDALLAYLWDVHRVDYYGGREDWAGAAPLPGSAAAEAAEAAAVEAAVAAAAAPPPGDDRRGGPGPGDRARPRVPIRRTLRPPRAAAEAALAAAGVVGEGGSAPAAANGDDAPAPASPTPAARAAAERWRDTYRRRIDGHWHGRLKHGDPLFSRAAAAAVEAGLAAWVEAQVVKHGDARWGNKLSAKLFVGREFVVKHVRTKHPAALEAARARVCDDLFFEAWARAREADGPPPGWGGGGGPGGPGGGPPFPPFGGPHPPYGMGGGPPGPYGPGGPRGPPRGGGPGGPGGGGGGGPRGPMRGPPPPRGGPPGGGGGGRGGGRGYLDLDDPRNNRAVLDYGDL